MHIMFHLGAHCTDDGLLIRSILRNRAKLAQEGICVPGPGRYKELIGDVSTKLRGAAADASTEAMLIEAIRDDDSADRLVLSSENLVCRAEAALDSHQLYPKAAKAAWLRQCFPSHTAEFALALRNPASFLPDMAKRLGGLPQTEPQQLAWSDTVLRLVQAVPDSRVVVWCHEDSPFLWSEIIQELTWHEPFTQLDGEFDMVETIMTPNGFAGLQEFLTEHEVENQNQRRRAVAAFLEAHAIEEQVSAKVDLPGWTDSTISELTARYDEDIERIARMPEVTFLSP